MYNVPKIIKVGWQ